MGEKTCPRCKKYFECNTHDIQNCFCNKVTLSKDLKYFLSKTSYNCLCKNCLQELENTVAEAKKESFPIKRESYIEGKHFYMENDLFVFTEYFHIVKGECCRNSCRHCAYGYSK
jgi:hypothetical protein